LLAALTAGCSQSPLFSASIWDPFGLTRGFGLHDEPLRIGLSHEHGGIFDVRSWGKKVPWDALVRDLSTHVGRPVVVENYQPFQIGLHLRDTGRLHFALVGADDFLAMTKEEPVGKVVALSEARVRQGVIVARAKSSIEKISDLQGKWFAFGPKDDPVLHQATAAFLADAGMPSSEMGTLIPGLPQFHISSREAAKEIAYGLGTEAGVIEAAEFDAYPQTGGRWIPFVETFSKDQFRVLGRTPPTRVDTMAEGPLIASDQTDADLVEKVRDFLLSADTEHPQVVESLGFARFRPAPADPERSRHDCLADDRQRADARPQQRAVGPADRSPRIVHAFVRCSDRRGGPRSARR
jgi:ABC-type phosphate/phosphonate transport system substrate-binding protein